MDTFLSLLTIGCDVCRLDRVAENLIIRRLRPSPSRSLIRRSNTASHCRLRAKLSSVMKRARTPRAECSRTLHSTSSGARQRTVRPWTLMIVQKLHWNGQPRPQSTVALDEMLRSRLARGATGSGALNEPRRLGQVVVKRPQGAVIGIAEHLLKPPFGFACEQGYAEVPCFGCPAEFRKSSPAYR